MPSFCNATIVANPDAGLTFAQILATTTTAKNKKNASFL
jgi:hypothetical protein